MNEIIPVNVGQFLAEHQDDFTELNEVIEMVVQGVHGQSKRIYRYDGRAFGHWLITNHLTPRTLNRDYMRTYHEHLDKLYKAITAQRMWSVAHSILAEYVASDRLMKHPMERVKGFSSSDETTHTVLVKAEAERMLAQVDRQTTIGKRDYVLLQVLLRTGLRRFEAAKLVLGDLRYTQGHHILVVVGKRDIRANVKLPVDVYRHIQDYLAACDIEIDVTRPAERSTQVDALPLFFGFKRDHDHTPTYKPITDHQVYRIVLKYGRLAGLDVTPHGLRATLITYLLGEGVPLHKVQYAVRHKDPKTTERYHKGKENLDDSALDRFHL